MLDQDESTDENIAWPGYVDFLCTFVFVLIIFIGSLLYLLSGDINKRIINKRIAPVEQKLKSAGMPYLREGSKLLFKLNGKVEFETNAVKIRPDQERFLREIGNQFTSPGLKKIMVKGLADSQPCLSDPFCNWDISSRRATEVLKFYYNCTDCGFDARIRKMLILSGEGDTSSDSSGRANSSDRRVDIILDFDETHK